MSQFKNKLRQEVIDPVQNADRIYTFEATALTNNKKRGKYCRVRYINENGKEVIERGELTRIYGNDTVGGWFPKNGEIVLVEKRRGTLTIISSLINNYDEHIKDYSLKYDKFSNMFTGPAPNILF